jgi:branched-chain amino acid transport system permease protein
MQLLIYGLLLGGIYALMASGLSLLYGVMKIVNLAHAAFMVLAAYIAFELYQRLGLDPFLSMLVTVPALFGLGIVVYVVLLERIPQTSQYGSMTVLLTFGVALIIEGGLTEGFSGIYHSTSPGYATSSIHITATLVIPEGQLYAFIASVSLLGLLGAFLYGTRTGYAIRATMQNRVAAQLVGVNVRRISMFTCAIGSALAGAAGSLFSYLFSFFPDIHWQFITLLLSLIVVGGLGSLAGPLIAALGLSILAAYLAHWVSPVWSYLTFYIALFATLLVRPQGIMGKDMRITR